MPYKLDFQQTHELLTQPESGMGYQIVETVMRDAAALKGVILNAEVFIPFDKMQKIMGRQYLSFATILMEAEQPGYIRKIKVISKEIELRESNKFFTKSTAALKADITLSSKGEVFKRFSDYKNDKRVTESGGLLPGSFATTEEDACNATTGSQAVNRYAMPSDEPAIYVFTIKPPEKTELRRGVVEPAYGKPGGGIEVIFVNGSSEKTVTGPDTIPAK